MAHYGCALANGEGVRKNKKSAMEWLIKAAMKGDEGAILILKEDYDYTLNDKDTFSASRGRCFSWYNRNIFHGGSFMLIPYRSVRTPCRKETEIKNQYLLRSFSL